jgi:hypothetical protein
MSAAEEEGQPMDVDSSAAKVVLITISSSFNSQAKKRPVKVHEGDSDDDYLDDEVRFLLPFLRSMAFLISFLGRSKGLLA